MNSTVYTIGHSTHTVEKLIELLKSHGISAIADVRSQPYSRFNSQFNRENLKGALKKAGISYVFLGDVLGARPQDPRCYVDGKVQYNLIAATPEFKHGLNRISQGMQNHRISILCSEKDPLGCHRTILVARHLVRRGIEVQHIRADGTLESHSHVLKRLLKELGLQERELFRTCDEIIEEAYQTRGDQIAYEETTHNGSKEKYEVRV